MKTVRRCLCNHFAALPVCVIISAAPVSQAAILGFSNLDHLDNTPSSSWVIPFGEDINRVVPTIAQRFHTGTSKGEYLIDSITLPFRDALGDPTGFTLSIYSSDPQGVPDVPLRVLTGDPDPDKTGLYEYGANGFPLLGDTDYFLVMRGERTSIFQNDQYLWGRSTGYVPANADGWDDGPIYYTITDRHDDTGPWTSWAYTYPGTFSIAVVPEPRTSAIAVAFTLLLMTGKRFLNRLRGRSRDGARARFASAQSGPQ
jgi:hypothetical protein